MPRSDDPIAGRTQPRPPPHPHVPQHLVARHGGFVPELYTHPDTLLVAFAFRCNLACTFCMVEDALDAYPGTPLHVFRDFAADEEAMAPIRRVVLSGGEVTLDDAVLDYIRCAAAAPGVQHVRIQTNATRLHDRGFLNELIDAGVDEFFVSLHGHDPATCDAITQRPGSFKAILRGLEGISASSATLYTNTCIVAENVEHLPEIADVAIRFGAKGAEFWNVWPRITDQSARGPIVAVDTIAPFLRQALQKCRDRGLSATVKWFPKCLLGPFADAHDDSQPTSLIDAKYWQTLPSYRCLFSGICSEGQRCSGLSSEYVAQHGWEVDTLRPQRIADLEQPTDKTRPTSTGAPPLFPREVGDWRWIEEQPAGAGCRALYRAVAETGATSDVWVRATPQGPADKALATAAGWSLAYESGVQQPRKAADLVQTIAELWR